MDIKSVSFISIAPHFIFIAANLFGRFHLKEYLEESGVILDTPPCRVGCMRNLAHTPPRAGEEYGSNTTRRSRVVFGPYSSPARGGVWGQIQRDKPKYHEAKPSGIWAYRVVFASQNSEISPNTTRRSRVVFGLIRGNGNSCNFAPIAHGIAKCSQGYLLLTPPDLPGILP